MKIKKKRLGGSGVRCAGVAGGGGARGRVGGSGWM